MSFSSKNIFSFILIISVVFVLFLSSPVYKMITGEGMGSFRLLEGMTTSEATSLGLTGDGSANNPYIIPQKFIVRPADPQWQQKIKNEDKTETGVNPWSPDDQFKSLGGPNFIGNQYQYFAEWWLAKYNPKATPNIFFGANVKGNNYSGSLSNYGLYKFVITAKNSNGTINYSGTFNNKGWSWTSGVISPAPAPIIAPVAARATPATPATSTPALSIPNPTSQDKASFESKKCNKLSSRDGNCIPVAVAIKDGKVVGPPYKIYGNPGNAVGPDGLPFNQNTANYFFEKNTTGSEGQYYPITDNKYSRMMYGKDTDGTKDYECAPIGSKQSDGSKAQCMKQPTPTPPPPKPTPSGPCDPTCRKVKDPRFAGSACKLDKGTDKIVCYACPLVDGEINCNNYMATCSGCGDVLRAQFDQNKKYPEPGPKEKPFSPTECEINCEKPGLRIFKKYLDTFRDGSGFDDGSCEIIGRNTIKCRPVRKGTGVGEANGKGSNGGMKPIPSPDECILCDQEELHGYATFDRKWDNYAKQNDYVNVKLVDKPEGRRGASYGPSDGSSSGGRSGRSNENWEKWNGGDSSNGAGWRGKQTGGWYQSMNDVKSKSFQVAAANMESSRQQAYVESLKLELNKVNDEYTTQQAAVNNMKSNIDKQVSACQDAKSKLRDAKMSSVSDDMNKNSAITLKEKMDANTKSENIAMLEQNVKSSCDNATNFSNSYNDAVKQLSSIDKKRQALIEKLVIAMNSVTDSKTTININVGGLGGMGDCGDRLGCGTGIEYNNMYTSDYFKPQYIDDMINKVNIPMPYQDIILF